MCNYVKVCVVLCACLALTFAQFDHFGFGYENNFLNPGFGAPNVMFAAGGRDPRANTGPVVFPPSPPGDPSQTSGVVVGASGFGFVPPGSQGHYAVPRYFYRGFFAR